MANTILTKSRGADGTVPHATNGLKIAELGVNTYDGRVYLGTKLGNASGNTAGGTSAEATWVGAPILDEDAFGSNSDVKLATQASIKAYVDANAGTGDITGVTLATDSGSVADTSANVDFTISGGEGIDTSATGSTVYIAGEDATSANKGIASFSTDNFSVSSGAVTIKNSGVANAELAGSIANAKLSNSSVTVTAGTGLSGGGAVSLGSSVSLAADLNELTTETTISQGDFVAMVDATDSGSGKITLSNLEDEIFGNVSGDATIAAGGALTIAANSVALSTDTTGNYVATVAGTANEVSVSGSGSEGAAVTVGLPTNVTIAGNLTVSGTTTTVQNVAIGTADSITFEGATPNEFETTLTVTDPTAARTITLPNVTGTVVTTGDSATVTAAMLAANSVDSSELVNGSVDNSHLADDAVDSDEIAAGAIDLAHMSANSVDSTQYVDGSIDTAHIANDQITNALMADDAIDSDQIASGAVDNAHLAGSIAYGKISLTGAILNADLAGSIANAKLANSAITIAGASTSLGGTISAATIASAIDSETMTLTNTTIDGGAYSTT